MVVQIGGGAPYPTDIPYHTVQCCLFFHCRDGVDFQDVLVHVMDVSHPDIKVQKQTVYDVLNMLQIPQNLMDNVITVFNKMDISR